MSGLVSMDKEGLIERIKQAETKAQECQIEAAVYRRQLMKCEELADKAKQTDHLDFLCGVSSQASLTLDEQNVKKWGKEWKDVWEWDIKWLKTTLKALKEIQDAVSKLSVEDQHNATLKAQIQAVAERALIQHVPSSVSVSD